MAPTSRKETPDLALAPTERAAATAPPVARATPAYGEAIGESVVPTIALGPGAAATAQTKGDTILLPRSGLPENVSVQSSESWREATTATSLGAANVTEQELRPASADPAEALPRFPWLLVIFGAVAAVAIGSVGAWIVLGGERSNDDAVAQRADAPKETPADPAPEAVEPAPEEPEPNALIIGADEGDPAAPADAEPQAEGEDPQDARVAAAQDEQEAPAAEDPSAAEADPEPSASTRSGSGSRAGSKPPRQTASKTTVPVHVRLAKDLPSAELKIGTRKIHAAPYFDGLLPVGRHRVSWRRNASDAWHAAGSFNFVEGAEYVVRISSNGPRLETM